MRAAVYLPGADDLAVETVIPFPPAERDVVLRVTATGVCHSDQAVIDGKRMGPIMLGHETTRIGGFADVKGSYYGSARVTRDFPRFIELIESGRLDVASMITRQYALDDVNDAFAAMRDDEVVRGVVVPG